MSDLISQVRLLMCNSYDYVDNPAFLRPKIESELFGSETENMTLPPISWYVPTLETIKNTCIHLMKKETERLMFLRFNYSKRQLNKLKTSIAGEVNLDDATKFMFWHERAEFFREYIVRSNLALAPSMFRRMKIRTEDFAEIVSMCNIALLRAVERFDVGRGFKFSTYACNAIIKAISNCRWKESRYQTRNLPYDEIKSSDRWQCKKREDNDGELCDYLDMIVKSNSAGLSRIELFVIRQRFNLNKANESRLTLEEISEIVGLTKERIRQIQNQALAKIRQKMLAAA